MSRITSDYSPVDLAPWVTPWVRQSLGSFARLSKFPDTTTGPVSPDDLPFGSWSTHHAADQPRSICARNLSSRRLGSLGPYIRRSFGLSLFLRGPRPVAESGTNPRRRSDQGGWPVLRSTQIHTPSCSPLAGIAVFQVTVTRLPSHPVRRRMFTLNLHRLPSDWWLPLAAYLGPLPPSHCPYSFIEDTARCKCRGASAWLVRSSPSSHAPPSKCTLA